MERVKKSPTEGKAKEIKTERCLPGTTEGLEGLVVFSAPTHFSNLIIYVLKIIQKPR